MTDKIDQSARSANMSKVRNKNTGPEMYVRRALHAAGFRFRLHRRDLPGSPDIVLPRWKTAVFVHGCLWHGHDCSRGKLPATNVSFWEVKVAKNMARDEQAQERLIQAGWAPVVLWQCRLKSDVAVLIDQIRTMRAPFEVSAAKSN